MRDGDVTEICAAHGARDATFLRGHSSRRRLQAGDGAHRVCGDSV
jgi:hypothetical protein